MNAARFRGFAGSLLILAVLFATGNASTAAAQTRRAFRVSSLKLSDPQIFHPTIGGCTNAINGIIDSAINVQFLNVCEPVTEGVPDPCTFDLNLVAVFDPLVQTAGPTTALVQCMSGGMPCELDFAAISECTRTGGTAGTVACNNDASFVFPTTYFTGGFVGGVGATCLAPIPNTFGRNNTGTGTGLPVPVVATAAGNCAVTGQFELNLSVGDGLLTIPLRGAQLGARFVGNPATSLAGGLARGFLSETDAEAIRIDIDTPIVIHSTLAGLLAGGEGNCNTTYDDRDYNPPGDTNGERGWWFYLTIAGTLVTVPEFPTPTATSTMGLASTPTPTPPPTSTPVSTATVTNTPALTNTPVPTDTPTNTPPPTDTPPPPVTDTPSNTPVPTVGLSCPCDCDGDAETEINELVRCANIYLETQLLASCPSGDRDGDGAISIGEVVGGSRRYQLDDCDTFLNP